MSCGWRPWTRAWWRAAFDEHGHFFAFQLGVACQAFHDWMWP